ncbi:MAG: RecQ family ATP-dependent DNA helicase [Armatimonadetes bacterium]|nr:RecQ family ATP-dependent DNA helicase [Armatimonadota bacterium]
MQTPDPIAPIPVEPADLLREHFGWSEFKGGQEAVIRSLLAGRSALAVFPTGGGKSLCYQLSALVFPGVTVVVSPLIALMKDQIDFLHRHNIAAARLDSSLSLDETKAVEAGMVAGTLKLLYVSPERFNNERFLSLLSRTHLSLFAVDEAHCISEWGHNFRPDYLKLAETARTLGAERALALTATATPAVAEDIRKAFDIAPADTVITGFYRSNLRFATTPVSADKRDALLLSRLQKRKPGATIVYVTLQKTAERIAAYLAASGFNAVAYHAGMENEARASVQDAFMASPDTVVVATIAFGMGIDKADVRYVYHYNLPHSLEAYSQEIGRAGRDGEPSTVELLACPDDVPTLQNFAYGDTPTYAAIFALVSELLSLGERFDVALYDLSSRFDIRLLVMKTVLTYLELMGVVKQGTPFYAGYEFRPLPPHTPATIAGAFPGAAGELVTNLFAMAKRGKIWFSLNPETVAESLGVERKRVTRALEVMEERGFIELRASDTRQVFTRLRPEEDATAITEDLMARFVTREENEITRLRRVLQLVTHDGCQVNELVGYFGETRDAPCGHCTFCLTGKRQVLPSATEPPPLDDAVLEQATQLQEQFPDALGSDRQLARFLCGLSSPALTKARITKHALFGALESRPFGEVLDAVSG